MVGFKGLCYTDGQVERIKQERKMEMQDNEENQKTPMKTEFFFQIGIIVFVLLGVIIKQASWLFWILGIICAVCWVIFVEKRKRNEEENK